MMAYSHKTYLQKIRNRNIQIRQGIIYRRKLRDGAVEIMTVILNNYDKKYKSVFWKK